MNIISLFSGCGGLDLGFEKEGFSVIWANEHDKTITKTYNHNHMNTVLDTRSIVDINNEEIPYDIDGIIGGPPCQSWALSGNMKGLDDNRGKLFFEFLRVLRNKMPKFFLLENVSGMLSKTHVKTFEKLISLFEDVGYDIEYKLLNSGEFGVPQERKRVIVVGYRKNLGISFAFDDLEKEVKKISLLEAIGDMPNPRGYNSKDFVAENLIFPNQDYLIDSYSPRYMSRNRKREWEELSFTILAQGRHMPLHPSSSKMVKIDKDNWVFDKFSPHPYRRLSVRECARIQTFPDDFIFFYEKINQGYKMIGNAVPVKLATVLARKIKNDL